MASIFSYSVVDRGDVHVVSFRGELDLARRRGCLTGWSRYRDRPWSSTWAS